jgi:hypothetical protein
MPSALAVCRLMTNSNLVEEVMTMTPLPRRTALINSLRPTGDGAHDLYRRIALEMFELGVWSGYNP